MKERRRTLLYCLFNPLLSRCSSAPPASPFARQPHSGSSRALAPHALSATALPLPLAPPGALLPYQPTRLSHPPTLPLKSNCCPVTHTHKSACCLHRQTTTLRPTSQHTTAQPPLSCDCFRQPSSADRVAPFAPAASPCLHPQLLFFSPPPPTASFVLPAARCRAFGPSPCARDPRQTAESAAANMAWARTLRQTRKTRERPLPPHSPCTFQTTSTPPDAAHPSSLSPRCLAFARSKQT